MTVRVRRFATGSEFRREAGPFLLQAEPENHLMLGIAEAIGDDDPAYLATAEADGIIACAVRTPPFKAVLTSAPEAAVRAFARDLREEHADLPAVLASEREAVAFADEWCRHSGQTPRNGMRQGIYAVERVDWSGVGTEGWMRKLDSADRSLLEAWIPVFCRDAGVDAPEDLEAAVTARIVAGNAVVWETDRPVALAQAEGATPNGVRISLVYTPAPERGRGFAKALVANLADSFLRQGRRWCFLYTDLSNPVSNHVYERIGFRRVAEVLDVHFGSAG